MSGEYGGTGMPLAALRKDPAGSTPARLLPGMLLLALLCGCTTDSYKRDDGSMITVKKFIGIPYLENERRSTTRTPGSEYRPAR